MSILDQLVEEIKQLKETVPVDTSNDLVVELQSQLAAATKQIATMHDAFIEQELIIEKLEQEINNLKTFEVPVFNLSGEDVILASMKFQRWAKYIETADSNTPPPEDMSQEIKRGEIFTFVDVLPCWVYRGKSRNFRTGEYEYKWIQEKRVVVKSWNTGKIYTIPIEYIIDAKHNSRYSALMVALSNGDIPDHMLA